ncbi:hypothetical protein [Photobacterium kishitanii]|uniref:Uncharacterized protein n=1 Tax=Photobacterium kishitanii TaxID=318456 RepID=A0A2T3KM75_9GAMM|nr:hypothetical protein [Photobacterium kishitanii]PSV00903.1 hypothetical protein C9J27_02430 [Photobacterium kishitanii]
MAMCLVKKSNDGDVCFSFDLNIYAFLTDTFFSDYRGRYKRAVLIQCQSSESFNSSYINGLESEMMKIIFKVSIANVINYSATDCKEAALALNFLNNFDCKNKASELIKALQFISTHKGVGFDSIEVRLLE